MLENAKSEDTEENTALYNSIKKNEDGEPQDAFDSKVIKTNLKKYNKNSKEYELLHKVDLLLSNKSTLTKVIKELETELKNTAQDKIQTLTNAEIDSLVFIKWFGKTIDNIVNLVTIPIKSELKTLKELNERYSETIESIDLEISQLEKELQDMMKDLVVS